ncbi:MAG: 4-hydroxyphenylacetate 3-monooxygenase, oxygenase component [Deltaproteobacteria bacterium]|nr:4-hydroxyphenylacetate 3-monooxygenase, oxygenase component [Deltaproteobacteria bacterium]
MGIRTGAEFIAGLRDSREVWLGNEQVTDVTTHPAFRGAIGSLARLYDMQHEPAYHEALTYPSPTTGNPVGMSFLIPHTREELTRRRRMVKIWADATCGMMGRSADFLNTMVMAWAAKRDYFAQQSPECAERVGRYYEECRERDLFLTHALIDPQVDRSKNRAQQDDPYQCLRIVEETQQGLIVRGAKMVATAAPFADEILVWPFPPTLTEAEAPYAIVFIIPVAAPGLKIICRESFSHPDQFADHPLSARFDEMDAVAVFEDVLVPWERVFLHRDARLVAQMYAGTRIREMTAHQTNTRLLSKIEFVYGVLCLMAEAIGTQDTPAVQEMLGEAASYVEIIKSTLVTSEHEAQVDPSNGVMYPALQPLQVGRTWGPRIYPRLMEIVRRLGAGGLMQLPASIAAFDSPIGPDLEKYYRGAHISAREKVSLFKLAWDLLGSDFGARHTLYELYYAGDPSALMAGFHREFKKEESLARVKTFLQQGAE